MTAFLIYLMYESYKDVAKIEKQALREDTKKKGYLPTLEWRKIEGPWILVIGLMWFLDAVHILVSRLLDLVEAG